jgi:hypothetical protein
LRGAASCISVRITGAARVLTILLTLVLAALPLILIFISHDVFLSLISKISQLLAKEVVRLTSN